LAQTILPKVLAIPASRIMRKLSSYTDLGRSP
jgi:hypothetical protein